MSTYRKHYDAKYKKARAKLVGQPCVWCGAPATTADHVPPLSDFASPADWEGDLLPACAKCNFGHRAKRSRGRGGVDRRRRQPWRSL